ncbi:MAG: class B sortase [Eubacterium sp.]|nr:class B sortase [Eubacterium sp.]
MKILKKIVFCIAVCVFVFSGVTLFQYFNESKASQKEYIEKKEVMTLEQLHTENQDLYGWISIEDTNIDYPVMFTPQDPEFYLRKNFQKEDAQEGVPFVDGRTDMENSMSTFIYGHQMKNGYMFNNITKYDQEGFYENHKEVVLETIEEGKKVYEVFAFGKTNTDAEDFNVYNYLNIYTADQYDEFIRGAKDLTFCETDLIPQFGEKIIVLSTCSYHHENGRYVLMAVEK